MSNDNNQHFSIITSLNNNDYKPKITPKNLVISTNDKSSLIGSYRMCILIMLMMLFFCTTSLRMNLGMAIVCMVNSTAVNELTKTKQLAEKKIEITNKNNNILRCSRDTNGTKLELENEYQGTMVWEPEMQSQLFSAVFYGSLLTTWISGYLADRLGPKLLLTIMLVDSTIVTFFSPFLANLNYYLLFAARFLMGVGEGFLYPAVSTIATRWFPPQERSRIAAFYTTGNQLASVVGLSLSSQLCKIPLFGGWPLIFYTFGSISVITLILWLIFFSNYPNNNKWISIKEENYIYAKTSSQFQSPLIENSDKIKLPDLSQIRFKKKKEHLSTPWRAIFTSTAVYAILCPEISFCLTSVILQSYLPTYLKEVLQLNLNQNGLMSVLPFAVQLLSKNIYGWLSDTLNESKILSNTNTAKMFQSIGNFGCGAVFIVLALFVDCNTVELATLTLIFYGIFYSAGICGFFTSMISIAPAHSGIITSITISTGLLGSAVGPVLVAFFHETSSASEWRIIYLIIAGINFFSGIIFLIFGSAEVQDWGQPGYKNNYNSNKIKPETFSTNKNLFNCNKSK